MSANIITIARILLSFVSIIMFQYDFYWRSSAVVLTLIVFYMDSLDGVVARKLGVASDFGALFDITGDRIVEHVYWIFFTALGMVSIWVPIIFVSRSFLVDTVRSVAFSKTGKTPFGEKSMMKSSFTRFLTASRFSRGLYGFVKVTTFLFLGTILVFEKKLLIANEIFIVFKVTTEVLIWVTVAMNLIRGIPVLLDGRYYLFEDKYPRELKDAG